MLTWSGQHRLLIPLTAWDSLVFTDRCTRAPTSRSTIGLMLSLNRTQSQTRGHERSMTLSLTWGLGGAVGIVTVQGGGAPATDGGTRHPRMAGRGAGAD